MVSTRNNLDLSKLSIHQVILDQGEERMAQSNTSNGNNNLDDPYNTNSSGQSIKSDSSIINNNYSPPIHADTKETKVALPLILENQTTITDTASQLQSSNLLPDNNEDKELSRIPYYNGKSNIYAWLMAIKSVFIDLKYDEDTWANKAKYYLLDDAAQFAYINDEEMSTWNMFRKSMINQYSSDTKTQDPLHRCTDLSGAVSTPHQHLVYSSDVLAQKAHHALVLEDLKTLPKFSNADSESISAWLEEIELIYNKAFITDSDKCHRTLKLLLNVNEKWLEFIRRQKLEWNELKQKLISRFEGKKDPSRIQREDDVRNRRYHHNESMHHYYSDIMRKCDLLEEEYPVSDRHRVDYIIRGLPDSIQDQLLIQEYSTPKELLEVLQKIEEHRNRANFEQHVISIEENISSQVVQATPPHYYNVNHPSPYHYNVNHLPPHHYDVNHPPPHHYDVNHPQQHPTTNYNQQRPQQRSIQCYNCGKFGHKAVDCFKPKQHLN
jgi:hypothetical protein